MGDGTRTLTLDDIRPQCDIVDGQAFHWDEIIRAGDQVADIGCGHGPLRETVGNLGGRWIGIFTFVIRKRYQ